MDNTDQLAPLCFVLMPFGKKMDAAGRVTNFDSVYAKVIAPAVERAGLEPIRADEEKIGGTIHKPMFERLMLCHYAVADITGANPNVFYELGIRHAMRPRSTVIVFGEGTVLPFDIALVRGIAYKTDGAGEPVDAETTLGAIAGQLQAARGNPHDDSPIFQLVEGVPCWDIDHAKTDLFRAAADYSRRYKDRLRAAVKEGADSVKKVANEPALSNLLEVESGVVVDLFLSLRDVKAHAAMIELYHRMPLPLQRARMMREQLGFALNREGRFEEAEKVLAEVIAEFGPSSETNALLGRIYKDRWDLAKKEGRPEARALLKKAIDAYLAGFEADWRDAYPGVNAVTLMEMLPKADPRQAEILPVVRYSASRKAARAPDYWDHATLLELAVLACDQDDAHDKLAEALAVARAAWELETTARNLGLIRDMRESRGEDAAWIKQIEDVLKQRASRPEGDKTLS
ncbi:MAG TPA: TRAFs-binding domain-containing protein [Methyloceanibacter sp.]|jgi:tetratricopeptide (TPR) repeat protein|nr:TRAFs-binding domain-containing protein [Methyloceanibacter sp.]